MKSADWRIECDAASFERIKSEATFQQIVALCRAVNSLLFVVSAFDAQNTSPNGQQSSESAVHNASRLVH
jgi:hypothetical protein